MFKRREKKEKKKEKEKEKGPASSQAPTKLSESGEGGGEISDIETGTYLRTGPKPIRWWW